ncbi:ATP-grasp domain-containing protein [Ursidibacter sp. B-7004-1]
MNILITSAGQRVSLVYAFQNELKKVYPEGKVFTIDLNPSLAPACQISDGYFSAPRVTDNEYISYIVSICEKNKIKIVIPTIDTELLILSKNKSFFVEKGIFVLVSELGLIEKCRDKNLTNILFEEHSINIPTQYNRDNLCFPLFAKPCDGSLSKGIFIANSKDDIKQEHLDNKKLMFMEYISPSDYDEFTVDCYFDRNSYLKCVVPRKRIFVRAGEINKGVTRKNSIVKEFKDKLSFLEGAVGCLTIQVFCHKTTEKIIGIEINPRFGGGYPLSYLAGANYPLWIIKEYLYCEDIPDYDEWKNNLLMLRYDSEILVENYEK